MAYNERGLNAAVDGVIGLGSRLAPCVGDPGTDGSTIDTGVTPADADWGTPADGAVDSTQVAWTIPSGDGPKEYSHFAVITESTGDFVCGGELDQAESFTDNGGTLNFTGTITAESAGS